MCKCLHKNLICLIMHIIPFALRKKYRKYFLYILKSANKTHKITHFFFALRKNTANICEIFCEAQRLCGSFFGAQKIPKKLSQKQTKKIYGNRNICDIFCVSQKFAQILTVFLWSAKDTKKNAKKGRKKLWLPYGGKLVHNQSVNTFTLLSLIHILIQSIQGN